LPEFPTVRLALHAVKPKFHPGRKPGGKFGVADIVGHMREHRAPRAELRGNFKRLSQTEVRWVFALSEHVQHQQIEPGER
jgi:hypothetical protein